MLLLSSIRADSSGQFAQQRAAHVELEDQRRQVQELTQSKKQIQAELADLKDRLEVELMAKNEESSTTHIDSC